MTASSIGVISRGGPGSTTIAVRPRSTHSPGAVPFGLSSSVAPRGTIAWRRLFSGIVMPRRANRSLNAFDDAVVDVEPDAQARARRASRVTSSSVGPRPPVITTRSAHSSARLERPRHLVDVVADDPLKRTS